jgi:hypothetical protein
MISFGTKIIYHLFVMFGVVNAIIYVAIVTNAILTLTGVTNIFRRLVVIDLLHIEVRLACDCKS